MSALTSGDWVVADATDAAVRRECSGLVAAHLQWHLERALRSLPLVDRVPGGRHGPAAGGTGPWCSGHVATSRPGRTARTGVTE